MAYYYDLDIWKKANEIILQIYKLTEKFPRTEVYSLVDQMKRASVSIASNIAEGSGQGTNLANIRFLNIARGSAVELEAQIRIAHTIGFISLEEYEKILNETNVLIRMISSFIKKKKEFENK